MSSAVCERTIHLPSKDQDWNERQALSYVTSAFQTFACICIDIRKTSLLDSVLLRYRTECFVETGSNIGNVIAAALRCGLGKVFSIELQI